MLIKRKKIKMFSKKEESRNRQELRIINIFALSKGGKA